MPRNRKNKSRGQAQTAKVNVSSSSKSSSGSPDVVTSPIAAAAASESELPSVIDDIQENLASTQTNPIEKIENNGNVEKSVPIDLPTEQISTEKDESKATLPIPSEANAFEVQTGKKKRNRNRNRRNNLSNTADSSETTSSTSTREISPINTTQNTTGTILPTDNVEINLATVEQLSNAVPSLSESSNKPVDETTDSQMIETATFVEINDEKPIGIVPVVSENKNIEALKDESTEQPLTESSEKMIEITEITKIEQLQNVDSGSIQQTASKAENASKESPKSNKKQIKKVNVSSDVLDELGPKINVSTTPDENAKALNTTEEKGKIVTPKPKEKSIEQELKNVKEQSVVGVKHETTEIENTTQSKESPKPSPKSSPKEMKKGKGKKNLNPNTSNQAAQQPEKETSLAIPEKIFEEKYASSTVEKIENDLKMEEKTIDSPKIEEQNDKYSGIDKPAPEIESEHTAPKGTESEKTVLEDEKGEQMPRRSIETQKIEKAIPEDGTAIIWQALEKAKKSSEPVEIQVEEDAPPKSVKTNPKIADVQIPIVHAVRDEKNVQEATISLITLLDTDPSAPINKNQPVKSKKSKDSDLAPNTQQQKSKGSIPFAEKEPKAPPQEKKSNETQEPKKSPESKKKDGKSSPKSTKNVKITQLAPPLSKPDKQQQTIEGNMQSEPFVAAVNVLPSEPTDRLDSARHQQKTTKESDSPIKETKTSTPERKVAEIQQVKISPESPKKKDAKPSPKTTKKQEKSSQHQQASPNADKKRPAAEENVPQQPSTIVVAENLSFNEATEKESSPTAQKEIATKENSPTEKITKTSFTEKKFHEQQAKTSPEPKANEQKSPPKSVKNDQKKQPDAKTERTPPPNVAPENFVLSEAMNSGRDQLDSLLPVQQKLAGESISPQKKPKSSSPEKKILEQQQVKKSPESNKKDGKTSPKGLKSEKSAQQQKQLVLKSEIASPIEENQPPDEPPNSAADLLDLPMPSSGAIANETETIDTVSKNVQGSDFVPSVEEADAAKSLDTELVTMCDKLTNDNDNANNNANSKASSPATHKTTKNELNLQQCVKLIEIEKTKANECEADKLHSLAKPNPQVTQVELIDILDVKMNEPIVAPSVANNKNETDTSTNHENTKEKVEIENDIDDNKINEEKQAKVEQDTVESTLENIADASPPESKPLPNSKPIIPPKPDHLVSSSKKKQAKANERTNINDEAKSREKTIKIVSASGVLDEFDSEEDYIEYKFMPRQVFISTICQLCKTPTKESDRILCPHCQMVSYCGDEHLNKNGPLHKGLCGAIQEIAKKRGNFFLHFFFNSENTFKFTNSSNRWSRIQ